MGIFRWPIEVGDRDGRRFERLEALADTGSSYTVVPAEILRRLGIEPGETIEFEIADGRTVDRSVAEALVRIDARSATTIVVFGALRDPVLLGAHALGARGWPLIPFASAWCPHERC